MESCTNSLAGRLNFLIEIREFTIDEKADITFNFSDTTAPILGLVYVASFHFF